MLVTEDKKARYVETVSGFFVFDEPVNDSQIIY